jgi:hypothetical protein
MFLYLDTTTKAVNSTPHPPTPRTIIANNKHVQFAFFKFVFKVKTF